MTKQKRQLSIKQLSALRYAALISYLGLIFWIVLWHTLFFPSLQYNPIYVMLAWLFPLLLPLKGILEGKPYTHLWAGFILMIYFLHGFTLLLDIEPKRYFAAIEILLTAISFGCCSFYAKFQGRHLGLSLPKLSEIEKEEKSRYQD